MKKLLILLLIIISVNCFSQTPAGQKADSILLSEATVFVDSLVKNTSIEMLRGWIYETVTAKQHDEFLIFYNAFLQQKYVAWIEQKRLNNSKK